MLRKQTTVLVAGICMSIALLAIVSQLTQYRRKVLVQQKLWGWSMGYEHHEQPPFQTFPAKDTNSKAAMQQLWGFNMGYEHHEQPPFQTFPAKDTNSKAAMQQLWGFNMGYEHHEQKPIYFGVVPLEAARQMQLWGWDADTTKSIGKTVDNNTPASMPAKQMLAVDYSDSEAESNMNPAMGRGSDLHVLNDAGVWTKPEFKSMDDNYAFHSLIGNSDA